MTVARLVKNSFEQVRLGGVGNKLADEIEAKTGIEARCTILGYLQRGGSPTAFDRVLSTRYGSAAVEACLAGAYNVMVALSSGEIVRIPIEEVAGKPHQVPLDSGSYQGREEPWDFLWGLTSMKRAAVHVGSSFSCLKGMKKRLWRPS